VRKIGRARGIAGVALAVLCVMVSLTVSLTAAKMSTRHTYQLRLAQAEHIGFAAGQAHRFVVLRDGYYALQLWGAQGGDSQNSWNGGHEIYRLGGRGGRVTAVAYLTAGTVLYIVVGTWGQTIAGGFNGGGSGGADYAPLYNDYFGGGGGGATDVRLHTDALADRVLVAGGGGGGSGGNLNSFGNGYAPAQGGDGGWAPTFAGSDGRGTGYGGGGLTAGGEGYQAGDLGTGGGGRYSGGGGGGGYFGGGGAYGSGGGGGGGSSYIAPGFAQDAPTGLPDRAEYAADMQDGYAIVSYLGPRR